MPHTAETSHLQVPALRCGYKIAIGPKNRVFVTTHKKDGVLIYDGLTRKTPAAAGKVYKIGTGGHTKAICIAPDESWMIGTSETGFVKVRADDEVKSKTPPTLKVYVMYNDRSTVVSPESIAMWHGGLYASCDSALHEVHMVCDNTNTNWTLAGKAEPGFADGTGDGASFCAPQGLAVLPDGDLVVADTGNNALRRVTPAGVVTTLELDVGADGRGLLAPTDVAVDMHGVIVVADSGNHRVCLVRDNKLETLGEAFEPEMAPVALALDQNGFVLGVPRSKPGVLVKMTSALLGPGLASYAEVVRRMHTDVFSRLTAGLLARGTPSFARVNKPFMWTKEEKITTLRIRIENMERHVARAKACALRLLEEDALEVEHWQNEYELPGEGAASEPGEESIFRCPITLSVMIDPVVAKDENTYERAAIERWFATNDRFPLTNVRATGPDARALVSNRPLAALLQEQRERKRQRLMDVVDNGGSLVYCER